MKQIDGDEINEPNLPAEVDKRELLERGVFDFADANDWKIPEKEPGSRHPGVCWQVDAEGSSAILYKGTSQQPIRAKYLPAYAILEPNKENGLAFRTYFRVTQPHQFRLRKLELLYHDRLIGKLSEDDAAVITRVLRDLQEAIDGN